MNHLPMLILKLPEFTNTKTSIRSLTVPIKIFLLKFEKATLTGALYNLKNFLLCMEIAKLTTKGTNPEKHSEQLKKLKSIIK